MEEPQDVYYEQKEAKQLKLSLVYFSLSLFFLNLLKDKPLFSAKWPDTLPE